MQTYADMTKEQLQEELTKVRQIYKEYQDKGLKLDMSRGNPSSGQLDLGMGLLNAVDAESLICLLYTSPSPRDRSVSRMPSSA